MIAYGRLKTKFQTVTSKSGRGRLLEVVAYMQEVPSIAIRILEEWLLMRYLKRDTLRLVVAKGGSTVSLSDERGMKEWRMGNGKRKTGNNESLKLGIS